MCSFASCLCHTMLKDLWLLSHFHTVCVGVIFPFVFFHVSVAVYNLSRAVCSVTLRADGVSQGPMGSRRLQFIAGPSASGGLVPCGRVGDRGG